MSEQPLWVSWDLPLFLTCPLSSLSPLTSSFLFLLLSLAGCEFPNSSKQSRLTNLPDFPGLSLTLLLSTDDKGCGPGWTNWPRLCPGWSLWADCCRLCCVSRAVWALPQGLCLCHLCPFSSASKEAVAGNVWHLDQGSASEFPCGFRPCM